jgi:UDP-N-acetylmuramate dehydrogenase
MTNSSVLPEPVEGLPLSQHSSKSEGQGFDKLSLSGVRGRLTPNAPLAPLIWFKSGGAAEHLFEPADVADLQAFLSSLDPAVPVMAIGLGSNLIVRDGSVPGVTIRLGKRFAGVSVIENPSPPPATPVPLARGGRILVCGGGASGISVSSFARDEGIAGLEFLRGIPGTVGGFVKMNGGAYGREVSDILVSADVILRSGEARTLQLRDMGYSYRHSMLPREAIVVSATFAGVPGDPAVIGAEMDRIAVERETSQPLRSKTGGSTFKNPQGHKAWALVDAAGCRGLTIGGAQVSEKHCNFLLNLGDATSADIEALGEDVRARVLAHSGVELEWEIQRVGLPLHALKGDEADLPAHLREGPGVGVSGHDDSVRMAHPQPLPQAGGEL